MICPKCGGEMRQYERNSVVIDQCTNCRGIFLDAGELERLTQAANAYYGQPAVSGGGYVSHGHGGHYGHKSGGGHRKRRGGFFENLFD